MNNYNNEEYYFDDAYVDDADEELKRWNILKWESSSSSSSSTSAGINSFKKNKLFYDFNIDEEVEINYEHCKDFVSSKLKNKKGIIKKKFYQYVVLEIDKELYPITFSYEWINKINKNEFIKEEEFKVEI